MNIGDVYYITWDIEGDVLIVDAVILLEIYNDNSHRFRVLGFDEYNTTAICMQDTLKHALMEFSKTKWYRFRSESSDAKHPNTEYWLQ